MVTKLSRLKEALAAGDEVTALRIAAGFGRLGDQKERIMKGWNAYTNPSFYEQLGLNPEALFRDAIAAIRERYDL